MANVKKIEATELPVLFGEKRRPSEVVENKEDLQLEGQAFESYSPKKGAIYRFPKWEDAVVKKQPVVEGGNQYQYLIGCQMSTDGGKTFVPAWFSLNHLGKRDVENTPVHPTWFALGNIGNRGAKLCEMGEIKASSEERHVLQPVFDKGRPVYEIAKDADNNPILEEDGSPKMVVKTQQSGPIYDLTPAA